MARSRVDWRVAVRKPAVLRCRAAVVAAGFDLQVDCPDLAMGRHIQYASLDLPQFRKRATKHIEALNHALRNIPAERVRMHVCWGNYEGPHHYDVPFADIVDIIFSGLPASISFEAANPRHAHEWALFETGSNEHQYSA